MAGMIDLGSVGCPTREKAGFQINILDSVSEKRAWDISAGQAVTLHVA